MRTPPEEPRMNPQLLMADDFTYKLFIMSGLGGFLSILNKTRNFDGGGRGWGSFSGAPKKLRSCGATGP
jgi:hypothetical protein